MAGITIFDGGTRGDRSKLRLERVVVGGSEGWHTRGSYLHPFRMCT